MEQERGLTPVIGIILLTAITVIMAAVMAGFALGEFGETVNSAPSSHQATFEFVEKDTNNDGNTDQVEITMTGGYNFDGRQVFLAGGTNGKQNWKNDLGGGNELTVGDSVTYSASNGDTIQIIFSSEEGERTKILTRYEV